MKKPALFLLKLYQKTWFLRRPSCRFYPSCSQYAYRSIELHGLLSGAMLATWRVLRCHPFHPGGVDHVPTVLTVIKKSHFHCAPTEHC